MSKLIKKIVFKFKALPAETKALVKEKKFRLGTYTFTTTVIVVAIAFIINMCISALPSRYTNLDLTSSDLYSINKQTEELVSSLEDEITIYWVVQEGYEDSVVEKLLENYKDLNKKVNIEKIDPVVNPSFTNKYTSESVYNNSLIVTNESGEKNQYISYYDIYETSYDDSYNTVTSFDGESALTSAINYVTSTTTSKVYYLSGHGEKKIPSNVEENFSKDNIALEELNLLTEEAVPEDCKALIIYSPSTDLSSDDAEKVRSYLSAGGDMMLFTDCSDTSLNNLYELMSEYGVKAVEGMVVEGNSNYFLSNYANYLIPTFGSHDITYPLIDGSYYVLVPMAHGIEQTREIEDVTVTPLLQTSEDAFSKLDGVNSTNANKESGDIDTEYGFALAVAITKTLEEGETNIVWISSSYITDSRMNEMVSGSNMDFVCNSLSWICDIENSITIRAKSINTEYLSLTSAQSSRWTIIMVAIVPLTFIIAGIIVWLKRRKL